MCEAIPDFTYEDTIEKDLECYDGWTDVGIFVYFGEEFVIDDCAGCIPPGEEEDDVVAYFFEVSFVPVIVVAPYWFCYLWMLTD